MQRHRNWLNAENTGLTLQWEPGRRLLENTHPANKKLCITCKWKWAWMTWNLWAQCLSKTKMLFLHYWKAKLFNLKRHQVLHQYQLSCFPGFMQIEIYNQLLETAQKIRILSRQKICLKYCCIQIWPIFQWENIVNKVYMASMQVLLYQIEW